MDAFIVVDGVSYAYPARSGMVIPALRDISLQIHKGEYIAVAGANGSGKSTLARMLNALLLPDRGTVKVAGLDTRHAQNHLAIRRTVGMVFQRPENQMIASTIEEDVAFGPENLAVPPEEIRNRVQHALDTVEMWALRKRSPDRVSAGQMQRVALAGVLAMQPDCIVFDEATAMLDPAGRKSVREFMRYLHQEGLTIIAITHFMEETLDADRLVVLHEGHVAMDASPGDVFQSRSALEVWGLDLPPAGRLAEKLLIAGVPLKGLILTISDLVAALEKAGKPKMRLPPEGESHAGMSAVISVRHLNYTYYAGTPRAQQALSDVNLQVNWRDPMGLVGPTGAGKSTLLQHINGLLCPQSGKVTIAGIDLRAPDTDLRLVRRLVGLVFQLPESQIFEQYVGDEIAYGPRLAGLEGKVLRERVRWAMELVGLDFTGSKDRPTFALSGGEKRKVALASILALRPSVLLLDEPTAGLDPISRQDLLGRLVGLAAEMTMVVSSHQMEDLAVLVNNLAVLDEGRIVLNGRLGYVFSQREELLELGLDVPVVVETVFALKTKGWTLPDGLCRDRELVHVLRDGYG